MKTQRRFFAKHAKSSAIVLSLSIHALLLVGAVTFVAIRVLIPEDPGFVGVEVDHNTPLIKPLPQLKPLIRTTRLLPRLEPIRIKAVNPKVASLIIPTIATISAPLGVDGLEAAEPIPFNMGSDLKFLGNMTQQGDKVVFLVHAGPATTSGQEHQQSPRSRMTFYTIRTRLNELVDELPCYTLFNVAFYWAGHTTPMSPKMLIATKENKQRMLDWGSTLNPLEATDTYGSSFNPAFRQSLAELKWPECIEEGLPKFGPKWYYNYTCGPEIAEFYKGARNGFENWARALCFAMEQKPDTIFILCTGYVIGNDDPGMMAASYKKMVRKIYGPDKKRYPTVNVVVLNKVGSDVQSAYKNRDKFLPITSAFRGKSGIIKNIKDVMTEEELDKLDYLD